MSFLSFLSSHRLHWGSNRAWIEPLPVQLDLLLHDQVLAEQPDHDIDQGGVALPGDHPMKAATGAASPATSLTDGP